MSYLKLGIIGQPLTHSLSPLLHAQLMHLLNLEGEYRKYELPSEAVAASLREFFQQGLRGLNVTIPHKVTVMSQMDSLSLEAQLAGAVNTIIFEPDGTLRGHNTDIAGFIRSLPSAVVDRLPESDLLILGAGGSARAVMTGLIEAETASITFAVRDPMKAISLTSDGEVIKQTYGSKTQIRLISLDSLPSLETFQGLVNTTPVGMWPNEAQSPLSPIQLETLPAGAFVYDLIYRPLETQLMQAARSLSLDAFNGLDMLLYQGVCAFECWQDQEVPQSLIEPLRAQLHQALKQVAP